MTTKGDISAKYVLGDMEPACPRLPTHRIVSDIMADVRRTNEAERISAVAYMGLENITRIVRS